MAKVDEYDMPDELYYHKEHMWVKIEGDKAKVGLNDFSQKLAGELSYIELPSEGDEVSQDDVVGTYETGKWMGKLFAPLSGEITAVNSALEDDASIVNKDPYGEGWMFEISIKDKSEIDNLMKGEDAVNWLKGEIAKHVKK